MSVNLEGTWTYDADGRRHFSRRAGMRLVFVEDDGGRAAAGFKVDAGDCVTRAIAIATGVDYRTVYDELGRRARSARGKAHGKSARDGVSRKIYERYLREVGWRWEPRVAIGSSERLHVDEVTGPAICRLSRHLTFVNAAGEIRDTFDPRRIAVFGATAGLSDEEFAEHVRDTRMVYGLFVPVTS